MKKQDVSKLNLIKKVNDLEKNRVRMNHQCHSPAECGRRRQTQSEHVPADNTMVNITTPDKPNPCSTMKHDG